ncbi:MAG TPA: hypothetical protein VLV31_13235 [Candidatus Acidoferrales bacterium]|nr:hypothetical protein [Candidatus Acidoferrales bacterium]
MLAYEAAKKGLSPNSLVSSVIMKYGNWDRFAEKFKLISINDDLFPRRSSFVIPFCCKIS